MRAYLAIYINENGVREGTVSENLGMAMGDLITMAFDAQERNGAVEFRVLDGYHVGNEDEWDELDDELMEKYDLFKLN